MRLTHILFSATVASALSLMPQLTPTANAQVRSNCNVRIVGRVRGSQVNMRTGPSTTFPARNFVLVGQSVNMMNFNNGQRMVEYDRDGKEWYFVEYTPSRTRGWIRGDFIAPVCN